MFISKANREKWKSLEGRPFKEKLQYFCDYYLFGTLLFLAVVAFAVSYIIDTTTKKDCAFRATFVNVVATDEKTYMSDFAEEVGIDTGEFDIFADTSITMNQDLTNDYASLYSVQQVTAQVAAREIDTFCVGEHLYTYLAYRDTVRDLSLVLDEETYAALEPYFFYIDMQVVEDAQRASEKMQEFAVPYPDPKDPESMTKPVPMGIYLTEATDEFKEVFYSVHPDPVIGFGSTTEHPEYALAFVRRAFGLD